MHLDWNKLRTFHVVAEAGSLTAAGAVLNLSQSAVSRQISALEAQLGASVFHRHARGLILSEQGELLLKATRDVHQKLAQIEGKISDSTNTADGLLKLTLPGFLGYSWLAPRLHRFQAEYPGVELTMVMDNRVFNLSMREADAAIRLYETVQPDLIVEKIGVLHIHLCASKAYIDEHGMPETAADLRRHRLIGYPSGVQLPHDQTDWIFRLAGVDKDNHRNLLLINSTQGMFAAARTGCGIACLPDFMVEDAPDLVRVLPKIKAPTVDLFFVFAAERQDSTKIQVFRSFLCDELARSKHL